MRVRVNPFKKSGLSLLQALRATGWLIIILNGVQVAMAQWISNGPPGEVNAIAIDPKTPATIYLGTYNRGLFKSVNGGVNWSAISVGLTTTNVTSLGIDPQIPTTIYAGTQGGGLFKSFNGGASWNASSTGFGNSSVTSLAIDPQTPTTIYLTGSLRNGEEVSEEVFKSIDSGGSWTAITIGLTSSDSFRTLAIDPQTPATLYAGSYYGGVFKSSNGGGSWSAVNTGLTSTQVYALAIDPKTPETLYAGTWGGGAFKSSNGGSSWSAVNSGLTNAYVSTLAIDPQNPSMLYVGTGGSGVFKSSDDGGNWTAINTGLTTSMWFQTLAIDPRTPATIYVGTSVGVFKSVNGGANWSASSMELTNSQVTSLAIDPQTPTTLYAGTAGTRGGGVFKSSNGGGNWSASGLTNHEIWTLTLDPQTPATLYAGTNGGVYKSTDSGGSWHAVNTGLNSTDVLALAIDPQTPTTLYAGTSWGGVFKSSNGGESWSTASNGVTINYVYSLAIDSQTPSTLYAGTNGGGVFKSSDGGGNWTAINTGLDVYLNIYALAIDPQTPTSLYAGTGGSIFMSSNGGESWSAVNIGLNDNPHVMALAIDPQTPTTLCAGSQRGLFKSSNGGESWGAVNTGLTKFDVRALVVDPQNPSRIYAGTQGGGVHVSSETSCSDSISPTASSYSSSGISSDRVTVTATGDCGWTAVSHDSWITITSGSSGSANGVVTFSVAPNTSPVSRTGTLTISGQTFTVTQTAVSSAFSLSSISPNSGPVTGGTSITLHGDRFQVGASVSLSGVRATVSNVTSTEITATTGITTAPGTYDVVVTNPGGQSVVLSKGFTYTAVSGPETEEVFVPIVLSSGGMNGSFYTSEMTLTNRGSGNATVNFIYTAALGSGSGTGMDTLAPGQQKIVPDTISYLRSLGVPLPSSGSQGGTLRVTFSGLASVSDGSVTVRTTTVVPEGRAGLAYAGIPASMALTGPSYLCGLRQNETDRSNVAVQHVGTAEDGNITLQLTVFSGAGGTLISRVLPEQVLAPGGFAQISGILTSNGLELTNGYVRVERTNGTAPYYAYGVINDQVNSDGSFIPPVLESALAGKTRMTLPAVVETDRYSTELVVTNWGSTQKTLNCYYVADALQTADHTASFTIELNAHEQLILPDSVQWLRDSQVPGIGPQGTSTAGALTVSVTTGDLSGVMMAARTSAAAGAGRYGVYYTAIPEGESSVQEAWLNGLQQNGENRTNLALVNTGEMDASEDTFSLELYDGETGTLANTVTGVTLPAQGWKQFNMILAQYAPGVTQGYARIMRTAGNNPFIAYAVINDGAQPGQRSGDGAFIASTP